MPRPKKEAKILNMRLSLPISEQLEKFCEESGMSKTTAVEKMLSKYLFDYFSKPEGERRFL